MTIGNKYHVEYAVGADAKAYSGFLVRINDGDGDGAGDGDTVFVFENRTTAYTEEKRIAERNIVSTTCYGEKAPWLS